MKNSQSKTAGRWTALHRIVGRSARTCSLSLSTILLFGLLAPTDSLGFGVTPFVEHPKVGEVATHQCKLIRGKTEGGFEHFTVVVESDTGDIYHLSGKAKRGVVNLAALGPNGDCMVTAKLLSRKRLPDGKVEAEIEIRKVVRLAADR